MGLFSFVGNLVGDLITGTCPWGPNGTVPIFKDSTEEPSETEEDKKPNYELLRSVTPIKIEDDGVHEIWFGKVHKSPDHKNHKYESTDEVQVDLHVKYKGQKPFYKSKIGLDAIVSEADNPQLFVPSFTAPPEDPDKEDEQLKKELEEYNKQELKRSLEGIAKEVSNEMLANIYKPKIYTSNDDAASAPEIPSYTTLFPKSIVSLDEPLVLPSHKIVPYQPPEDNRSLDQKIHDMTDPMARKCVSFVDGMAQQRDEDEQEMIRTAPSGYPLSSKHLVDLNSNGVTEGWTCGTPDVPKYKLEAPRPMPNGCHPIPPSAFPPWM